MECKYGHCKYDCRQQNELIDTLWNVNLLGTEMIIPSSNELIDTLWNVNVTVSLNF